MDIAVTSMKVVDSVIDVGVAACKAMPPGSRHRYYVNIQYEAGDGTVINSVVRGMTKPKLQARIKSNLEFIKRGCFFAMRTHDDREWMVILRISKYQYTHA